MDRSTGCISEAIDRSTEYLTTFYGSSPPLTVGLIEHAVYESTFPTEEHGGAEDFNVPSLAQVNQDQQPPSPQQVQTTTVWGKNVTLPSAHQQVMDPCKWSLAFRLRSVEGLKDGDIIVNIPSDGLLLECHPSAADMDGVTNLIKDEFL